MKKETKHTVSTIVQNENICILWVSGEVEDINLIVNWNGGFISPANSNSPSLYTSMRSLAVGNIEGDIITVLFDGGHLSFKEHRDTVVEKLRHWGIKNTL